MSTRATIFHTSNTHIYVETSEPQHALTQFTGCNIEMCIGVPDMKEWAIKDGTLKFKTQGDLFNQLPEFSAYGGDILDFSYDCDGFYITIKGGSYTAKELLSIKK